MAESVPLESVKLTLGNKSMSTLSRKPLLDQLPPDWWPELRKICKPGTGRYQRGEASSKSTQPREVGERISGTKYQGTTRPARETESASGAVPASSKDALRPLRKAPPRKLKLRNSTEPRVAPVQQTLPRKAPRKLEPRSVIQPSVSPIAQTPPPRGAPRKLERRGNSKAPQSNTSARKPEQLPRVPGKIERRGKVVPVSIRNVETNPSSLRQLPETLEEGSGIAHPTIASVSSTVIRTQQRQPVDHGHENRKDLADSESTSSYSVDMRDPVPQGKNYSKAFTVSTTPRGPIFGRGARPPARELQHKSEGNKISPDEYNGIEQTIDVHDPRQEIRSMMKHAIFSMTHLLQGFAWDGEFNPLGLAIDDCMLKVMFWAVDLQLDVDIEEQLDANIAAHTRYEYNPWLAVIDQSSLTDVSLRVREIRLALSHGENPDLEEVRGAVEELEKAVGSLTCSATAHRAILDPDGEVAMLRARLRGIHDRREAENETKGKRR